MAWQAIEGSASPLGLVVASSSSNPSIVDSISCKSCYKIFLSLNPCTPHCIVKFRNTYPNTDWHGNLFSSYH